MMQNKCVVKVEEEKKKNVEEKETAFPLQRAAVEPSQL